jgi:hypothetical protein
MSLGLPAAWSKCILGPVDNRLYHPIKNGKEKVILDTQERYKEKGETIYQTSLKLLTFIFQP